MKLFPVARPDALVDVMCVPAFLPIQLTTAQSVEKLTIIWLRKPSVSTPSIVASIAPVAFTPRPVPAVASNPHFPLTSILVTLLVYRIPLVAEVSSPSSLDNQV